MLTSTIACADATLAPANAATPAHTATPGWPARSFARRAVLAGGCTGDRGWRACAARWTRICSFCTTSRSSRCGTGACPTTRRSCGSPMSPAGDLVAPGRFLPAAERYGLIREIDRMVLDKVATLLAGEHGATGRARRHQPARRCRSPTGACWLTSSARSGSARVDPAQLVVEVTETAAISDMERAQAFCAGVQALGCAIALDDFGAGFGSFQYLKHLPFRYLKIDGDFIRGLPASPKDQLVVKALVGSRPRHGQADDRRVRRRRCRRWSCCASYGVDYAQGFEVGRPHPVAAARLASWRAPAYFGWGNCLRMAASHVRSVSRRRAADHELGRGRDRYPRGGRRRVIARSMTFATRSGPPPSSRIGPS